MAIERLVAGDSFSFADSSPDYPPSDGWTLYYGLVPTFSTPTQAPITLVAEADGEEYITSAAAAQTAAWAPGLYSRHRWVTKAEFRHTFEEEGNADAGLAALVAILPDPAQAAQGDDPRSFARKTLAAVEALILAQPGVEEYEIAGRRMKRADMLAYRERLKAEVFREDNAAAMRAGQPNRRFVSVRLARA